MDIRTGTGFDIHPLVKGIPLYIGGIEIPFHKGSKGHSDGDALIHAIVDALLGAANLGDIGELFPDTDFSLKGIRSSKILKKTLTLLSENNWEIGNIDSTIILEIPKLKSFKGKIAQNIATICHMTSDKVSIKAKTMEKMGDIGEGNAIMVFANVLIFKSEK